MAAEINADVIIVGSGIAGSLVAYELARAGVKVAILEAGPRVDRHQAVRQFRNAVAKVPECAYPLSPHAPHPTTDNPDGWYIQAGPDKFRSTYLRVVLRVVGGTTWHWLGTCLRFVPDDFRLQTKFGRGVDWPLTYDDLEPWYGAAEDALDVAGDASETFGSPRSKPYPMPAIPQTWLDRQFAQALAATRYDVRTTPQGRNSMDRDGRPACCGSASCIPICPIQAKYDATVHIAKAEASGAKLYDTTVAIFVEADGGRVTAIRFKRPDGSGGRAVGKVYVLAAHAVEAPRLLLVSRGDSTPNGVANGSDQVGRNLMDHPTQLSWALSDAPVWGLSRAAFHLRDRDVAHRPVARRACRVRRGDRQRRLVLANRGARLHRPRARWAGPFGRSAHRRAEGSDLAPDKARVVDRTVARSRKPDRAGFQPT
jgi:choline dehydrogenase-like flavoprotein